MNDALGVEITKKTSQRMISSLETTKAATMVMDPRGLRKKHFFFWNLSQSMEMTGN